MAEEKKNETKLRVEEGEPADVNRHVVRLSSSVMEKLKLQSGDVVKIKGKSETAALVLRAKPEDEERELIRMDGIIRSNAGVKLGDKVSIEHIEVEPATNLTLAPIDAGLKFSGDPSSWFRERLIDKPLMKGDKIAMGLLGTTIHFLVTTISPKGVGIVGHETKVKVSETPVKAPDKSKLPSVTYEDIGGLDEPIAKIREMVELPLKHPEVFERLGVGAPKGVLLHGPPGCGKTLLAKAVASESDANFIS
ncbi:MAG: AAA family ATPase, partial [Candidatus Diapherotrites archaeon]|nr:AAA family ATPase [Candidatus Diapherotrites archaeon]